MAADRIKIARLILEELVEQELGNVERKNAIRAKITAEKAKGVGP